MPEIPSTVVDKATWADLQELDQHGEGLTSWEVEFVESLTKQLRAGLTASPKQREQLDRMREERL